MPDNGCDVVVVGASAGGVEALTALARRLPADFEAPLFVVLHVPSYATSVLPAIMARAGSLPAAHAVDGEPIQPGKIYVAPPNCHLLLADGEVRLDSGPQENGHRPAIDPLFRSAARTFGERVAGVVLSGALDDGTAGLAAVKQAGGATLVQDPAEALYPSMPESARELVGPDHVLPVSELADVLVRLTAHAGSFEAERKEVDEMTETAPAPDAEQAQPGELMPFVCPDCGGNMWETEENGVHSFRCRVGHAFAMQTLVAKHGEMVEEALWTAYRALEERAGMSRRLARRLEERGRGESAGRFERQADAAARQAEQLKTILDAVSATGDAEVVSRD